MKKILLVVLSIICCFALFGCTQEQHDILNPYFTGKVIETNQNGCLVEVIDIGKGSFYLGEKVQVNFDSLKNPICKVGDEIKISFDGKVALSIPPQIFSSIISKVN